MAPELVGAIAGFLFGVVDGIVLHRVADKIEKTGKPDSENSARIIRYTAMVAPLIFAVMGYLVWPDLVPLFWPR